MKLHYLTIQKILFWGLMLICIAVAFLLFKDLADISQWVIQSEREFTMQVWYNRNLLLATVGGAAVISAVMWWRNRSLCNPKLFVALMGLTLFCVYSGYFNPQFMFRTMQHDAKFVSVEDAPSYFEKSLDYMAYGTDRHYESVDEISMIVLQSDQGPVAYADYYLLQPHVAKAGTVDGEEVVMTYCGLTNLGMAQSPIIGNQKLELGVFTQLENNLVMFDKHTNEPIQQLYGSFEGNPDAGTMKQHPTVRMPFGSYKELYPEGKVFVNNITGFSDNPVVAAWDWFTRNLIMYHGVALQWDSENPAFPTIEQFDERLPRKSLVYAFNVGDDYVAYSKDFLAEREVPLNTSVGGRAVVVDYSPKFDTVSAYFNDSGVPISSLDPYGQSEQGSLERVDTLKSEIFWFIWANFFPETDVNRV